MKLSKKNALVTGATTGIGKEIALRLARLGANVAICGRNEERLVSVGKELSRFGTKVILKNGDLTQRGFAASFVEDSAQPVSYTHLDVYKRQLILTSKLLRKSVFCYQMPYLCK